IVALGVDGRKVLLSKNGLFINRIDKVSADLSGKKYDAAYMGRITENKGVFDLLTVWAEVTKRDPKRKLAVMGTGRADVVEKFKNRIKEDKLENSVDYLGFAGGERKYEILKSSRLFIFLSKVNADESWGISLMEALACGLPAITYNLAIYNHVYDNGILQESEIGDVNSVIDKTLYLLGNEHERVSLSEKSMAFARQFDWFEIAQEDLDKIEEAIKL
ncbi:MAG: glycosyltransferase, partial [Candidatus Subteraquimicrobiales bacterium]|nr:glycosyltransferase [Candidatus Subteraquimicrobiales bacterium]